MSEIRHISKELVRVNLLDLHYQYLPGFVSMDIWNHDMSLLNSPQVECAQLLLKYGKQWSKLKNCRFAEDRRHRFELGMKKWTEKAIKEHILGSRYDILKSIKKRGFCSKRSAQQPVAILKHPFWDTRFNVGGNEGAIERYEIYHGGRRCAAMYALGFLEIPAFFAEDKHPGSGKGGKFSNKVLRHL